MDGGVIQNIVDIPEDIRIRVVDYDTDGAGSEDLSKIEYPNGETEEAYINYWDDMGDTWWGVVTLPEKDKKVEGDCVYKIEEEDT